MRVHELPAGQEFRCNSTWYRLVKLGAGSAVVDKVGSAKEHVIRDEEGNKIKHFLGHDRRITIGLTSEVDETRESAGRPPVEARQVHAPRGLQPVGKQSHAAPSSHAPGHKAPCRWEDKGAICGKLVSTHRRGYCVKHYYMARERGFK